MMRTVDAKTTAKLLDIVGFTRIKTLSKHDTRFRLRTTLDIAHIATSDDN